MRAAWIRTLFPIALDVLLLCAMAMDSRARSQASLAQNDSIKTSVCEIAGSPEKFDGKLIRVEAYISRGFEDSTLHDPGCPEEALINMRRVSHSEPHIWAEFADNVGYWHVTTFAPLVHNEQLKRLRAALVQRAPTRQMTFATMIGTFYAGKPITINGHVSSLRGYGHMSCCSLFVISQVESVRTDYDDGLDYAWSDWNVGLLQVATRNKCSACL